MVLIPHGGQATDQNAFRSLFQLPAAQHLQADLIALGHAMDQPRDPLDPKDGQDDEENPFTPAGYTYLGQFVDHDLTFDATSDLADLSTFQAASDARTPRFDLDNVYGAGPADQPYLYGQAGDAFDGTLLLGEPLKDGVRDVQRNALGRAVIGDPRNDENAIVVQIHAAFIRFHNAMVAHRRADKQAPPLSGAQLFAWAQHAVRHHYQRILLDDFLPRILDTEAATVKPLFDAIRAGTRPKPKVFPVAGAPFMPLEFAVAAYRLGHSMIRPGYRLAESPKADTPKSDALFPIFKGETDGLRGFRRLDPARGIDWSLFFHATLKAGTALDAAGRAANDAKNGPVDEKTGVAQLPQRRTQFAYKIDTMLVDPLGRLPEAVAPGQLPGSPDPTVLRSLAVRNLLRGRDFGLPSGERVADALGVPRLKPGDLTVRTDDFKLAKRRKIVDIAEGFAGDTPLWFYVLAEAEQGVLAALRKDPNTDPRSLGTRLGPVGAAIVAETFVGLMLLDPTSVLNAPAPFRSVTGGAGFSMVDMLRFIGALPAG